MNNTLWFLPLILIVFITWKVLFFRYRQMQSAKARGLWPKAGETPTDKDVKRLAKAGELYLAVKLYCKIHPENRKHARNIVEKLAK